MSDDAALRAELVKKARRAKVPVTSDMTVEDIEEALAKAAIDAAEEAPEPETAPETTLEAGTVKCRVTKWGDGEIFTGNGNERFKKDDIIILPIATAKSLEDRRFVEIQ